MYKVILEFWELDLSYLCILRGPSKLQIYLDIFQQLNLDIFYFSHFSSYSIIYYLGNCKTCTENMEYMIVRKRKMEIYNFFNSVKDKLQLIINNK